jgi:hypothetical protein
MEDQKLVDTHPKWNDKEFCAFLLLYSAMADEVITEEERALVLKNVDHKMYEKILAELNSMSPTEIQEILMIYKGLYFPTLARKKELLHKVKQEFYADQEFSDVEIELYNTLKEIM